MKTGMESEATVKRKTLISCRDEIEVGRSEERGQIRVKREKLELRDRTRGKWRHPTVEKWPSFPAAAIKPV